MGTRLTGVEIPVSLDTSKAQKQLNDLESKLNKEDKKTKDINRTLSMNKLMDAGSGVGGGQKTETPSGTSTKIQKQGNPVSGVMGKAISRGEALTNPGAKAVGLIEGFLSLPATKAAAAYAVASTVAKAAPIALEAIKGFNGGDTAASSALAKQFEELRSAFVYLESYVKSFVTGIGKTVDMSAAMARVNGKVPNITIGYGIYREAEFQEDTLRKKFDEFKHKEVAAAVGESMAELFKGGIN